MSVEATSEPQAKARVGAGARDLAPARVNLARRPFANIRPIQRLGIALWVIGAGLAVLAAVLFWRSLFGIETKQEELATIERQMAAERLRLETAEAALRRMNLRRQNEEAAYLNDRIAERTFPWSVLFEDLAEVLPREVRLFSLAPQSAARTTREATPARARDARSGRRVYLQMTGAAESDEALLALLDNFFASPYFDAPSLPRETFEGNTVRFTLSVYYLPDAPRAAASTPAAGAGAEVEELPAEEPAAGDAVEGSG